MTRGTSLKIRTANQSSYFRITIKLYSNISPKIDRDNPFIKKQPICGQFSEFP